MESVTGCSPVIEWKKVKKRKNKPKKAITSGNVNQVCAVRANDKNDSISRPVQHTGKRKRDHLPLSVNEKNIRASDQGTSRKKKKKKKKDTLKDKRGGQQQGKEGEAEDAAESIDSGCIADIVGDMTDWPQVETVLLEENKFISSFLSWLPVPKPEVLPEEEMETEGVHENVAVTHLEGLQSKYEEKLAELRKGRKKKPFDNALKKQELALCKKLKNAQKRKEKKLKRRIPLVKMQNEPEMKKGKNHIKNAKQQKPIYNQKGELVFSKFDFSSNTAGEIDTTMKSKDLKQLLSQALREKEKTKRLEQKGHTDAAAKMVEQRAWSGVLQKAEGVKVRDNVDLLKRSIKKKEVRKKTSQKKWDQRKESIEKKKLEKDAGRKKNIAARKVAKVNKKMKKMKQKGHIVPGF